MAEVKAGLSGRLVTLPVTRLMAAPMPWNAEWRERRQSVAVSRPAALSPVPSWVVASAAGTPLLLAAGWLVAGLLQPPSYSPMRQTVSVLAGLGTDGWIVTAGMLAAAGCYLVTAAGLTGVRWPGRLTLVVAGACSAGIATSPELASGPSASHLAWTVTGAATIAVFPVAASWRAPAVAAFLTFRGAVLVTAVFTILLCWVIAQSQGGSELGLAERVSSLAATAWPFVVASTLRRAAQASPRPDWP